MTAAASDGSGNVNFGSGIYIVPAYESLGFKSDDISLFSYPKSINNENSLAWAKDNDFAFSIAHQKMGNGSDAFDLITIILRGTETSAEAVGDAQAYRKEESFHGYRAYEFFLKYMRDVEAGLDYYLSTNKHAADFSTGKVKFLIGGHSLGGAAANLLAVDLVNTKKMGVSSSDVYAFTFGALNSITTDNSQASPSKYRYIWNYFNFYDTFGPCGDGAGGLGFGIKPTEGEFTCYNKFGNVVPFQKDYKPVFTRGDNQYKNHVMACYYDALSRGIARPDKEKENYYRSKLTCPVDVEVYDSQGSLVGRIRDNVVDADVTTIPMFVSGENNDVKNWLTPADGSTYLFKLIGTDDGEMSYFVEPFGNEFMPEEGSKLFQNVVLTFEKTMISEIGGNIDVPEVQLLVLDDNGAPIKQVQTDGTETVILPGGNNNNQGNSGNTSDGSSGGGGGSNSNNGTGTGKKPEDSKPPPLG